MSEASAAAAAGPKPSSRRAAAPEALRRLAARFDASVLDGQAQGARVRAVLRLAGRPRAGEALDFSIEGQRLRLRHASRRTRADAVLRAEPETWQRIVEDVRGGLDAYRSGRLVVRHDLHLGVSFLAATSGSRDPDRLRFERVETSAGSLSICSAGAGEPVILVHGLGATKVSFLPTVAALTGAFRAISVDLPGFGDSDKPLGGSYTPPFFARAVVALMDALGLERAHVIGNSMGGRVALELGLRHPERVRKLVLVCPSLAWKRARPWAPLVRVLRPELGLVQLAPRASIDRVVRGIIPGARSGWVQAGVDEFLRAYETPRGRLAFYASARQIYLEEPHGAKGFWTRLAGLQAPALFVWGARDWLVPIEFAGHVRDALPEAEHLDLDCGHVPQLERPDETHQAVTRFLADAPHGEAS